MDSNSINQTNFKTIQSQKRIINQKNSTLRQLQLSMINSLTKSPLVKVRDNSLKHIRQYEDYDDSSFDEESIIGKILNESQNNNVNEYFKLEDEYNITSFANKSCYFTPKFSLWKLMFLQ